MRKLVGAIVLTITSLLAYRYTIDRLRAQLMGAAHPAGALAAQDRIEYSDASRAVDETWVDMERIVRSSTPSADEVPNRAPDRRS